MIRLCKYAQVLMLGVMMVAVSACLKAKKRDPDPNPATPQSCPQGQTLVNQKCVPASTTPSPTLRPGGNENTLQTTRTVSSEFRYVILANGSNEHANFQEAKSKHPKALLAPAHETTLWRVKLQNDDGKSFRSKMLTPEVPGLKSKDEGSHTWSFENYFTTVGTSSLKFEVFALEACKLKYASNPTQCDSQEWWPPETSEGVVGKVSVPFHIVDLGINPADCAVINGITQVIKAILNKQTGDPVYGDVASVVGNSVSVNNNCVQ